MFDECACGLSTEKKKRKDGWRRRVSNKLKGEKRGKCRRNKKRRKKKRGEDKDRKEARMEVSE